MKFYLLAVFLLSAFSSVATAAEPINELLVSYGTGKQAGSSQHNSQFAVDYNFHLFRRTQRSGLTLGVGYTHLATDASRNTAIDAVSVYPQLTLWPVSPSLAGTYFFARALGPSYLSDNWLGDREQARHFAFQAQVGIGYRQQLDSDKALLVQLSWKHFSNANLFSANDGIDIPAVFTIGISF